MRKFLTTTLEIIGGILVVSGIANFSVPLAVVVFGVFLIILGGVTA
jgi:hypothetical protein